MTEFVGQTLDETYRIESEIGRGGMGTVYLATHLGTERLVAVKIIAPQFMQRQEFVERFRREAKAAGRLRHPNVVDVTDFGFAQTDVGQVAYLVMEYLDGCTLGEILAEEKNLPVAWTLDILAQVCSAVHEAHLQGIIHRDLKPDNIWLEPNQRGGYTVKVLDFGIAKLEEHTDTISDSFEIPKVSEATVHDGGRQTLVDAASGGGQTATMIAGNLTENATILQPLVIEGAHEVAVDSSESGTMLFADHPVEEVDAETVGTRLLDETKRQKSAVSSGLQLSIAENKTSTAELTRVGAVLGTPLYMSPEQCRGEKLDTRSDIYSLGVIAYQMLSGSTPFKGEFEEVMQCHKSQPPPPFAAKKVRRKLKQEIFAALDKNPDKRPQTAEAFEGKLTSRFEGIFGILRSAGMIYTEHLPKFIALSVLIFLPIIFLTSVSIGLGFVRASETISSGLSTFLFAITSLITFITATFCGYLITGTTTWIVTQSLAVPLRPIKLRSALVETKRRWRSFAFTGILSTVVQIVAGPFMAIPVAMFVFGICFLIFGMTAPTFIMTALAACIAGFLGFVLFSIYFMLVAPVVMMEKVRAFAALKRSYQLVRRSVATGFAAFLIMFLIPVVLASVITFVVGTSAKAFDPETFGRSHKEEALQTDENGSAAADVEDKPLNIKVGTGRGVSLDLDEGDKPDMQTRVKLTLMESLMQILLLPLQILAISLTAIITALMYLKTRQAGGESLRELLANFEEAEPTRKKWQERVQRRLQQTGRSTDNT